MILYIWHKASFLHSSKQGEEIFGILFARVFRELSLIRVSFVALGSPSHLNHFVAGGGGRGMGGQGSCWPLPL